ALNMRAVVVGRFDVGAVERDLGAGVLHLGVAAEVVHVAVSIDDVVDIAQAQAERLEGRGDVGGGRAKHAAVDDGGLRAANQVKVDQAATLERGGQAIDTLVNL